MIAAPRFSDPYRFDCPETAAVRIAARDFRDARKLHVAFQQRESPVADALTAAVEKARHELKRALRGHPVWPFLEPLPGARSAQMGLVIAAIGNPLRFPGVICTDGHYLPAGVLVEQEDGTVAAPRRRRGVQSNWNGEAKSSIVGARKNGNGLAQQIVKQRPQPYRGVYDAQKERLARERPDTPPFKIDRLAQLIAVKALIADMFIYWKNIAEAAVS